MAISAEYFIKKFNMQKHPEGGYFSEFYRSDEIVNKEYLPARYDSNRCFSTCIYFLLESDDFSAFHRVKSDEIWHFYAGTSLTLYAIDDNGEITRTTIGNKPESNESFYVFVKAGQWFAAQTDDPGSFTLVGCTVSPGFEFNDFELASRHMLIEQFPQHRELIQTLTR